MIACVPLLVFVDVFVAVFVFHFIFVQPFQAQVFLHPRKWYLTCVLAGEARPTNACRIHVFFILDHTAENAGTLCAGFAFFSFWTTQQKMIKHYVAVFVIHAIFAQFFRTQIVLRPRKWYLTQKCVQDSRPFHFGQRSRKRPKRVCRIRVFFILQHPAENDQHVRAGFASFSFWTAQQTTTKKCVCRIGVLCIWTMWIVRV